MYYTATTFINALDGEAAARETLHIFSHEVKDTFGLGMGMHESQRGNYETPKRIFEEGVNIFKSIRHINFQLVLTSEIGHTMTMEQAIQLALTS
jgi:hypothetical protein